MVDKQKSMKISVDNYNKLVDMKVDKETFDSLISRLIVNFPLPVDKKELSEFEQWKKKFITEVIV